MVNPKQAECLRLMMENPDITGRELAERLKVTEKTISQWKNHDAEFQDEYISQVRGRIQYAAAQALEKEIELLDSPNDMVAHLASKDLMDRAGFKPVEKVEQALDMDLNIKIDYGEAE